MTFPQTITMPQPTHYLHLLPEAALHALDLNCPFRAIVIAETAVSSAWQNAVSDWLIEAGCLFMLAWGVNCSSWDDALDWANIASCGLGPIPEDKFVITTWHDDETLEEVFDFAKQNAHHQAVNLRATLLLHISNTARQQTILEAYINAR